MKELQTNEFYDFSAFRLDVKKRRLMFGEAIVPLTPKEFDLLLILVENAGRVVEKDELLGAVWKNTFVEEGTLTRNISWLRKKIEAADPVEGRKVIETLPKRGYRFLLVVRETSPSDALIVEEQTRVHIHVEET